MATYGIADLVYEVLLAIKINECWGELMSVRKLRWIWNISWWHSTIQTILLILSIILMMDMHFCWHSCRYGRVRDGCVIQYCNNHRVIDNCQHELCKDMRRAGKQTIKWCVWCVSAFWFFCFCFGVFLLFFFFSGVIVSWRLLPRGEREKAAGNLNLCASS